MEIDDAHSLPAGAQAEAAFAGPVYIVDDDEAVRDSLQILLTTEGITADAFGSGEAFLGIAGSIRAGLVILDLHMPGLGGFDVLAALKARNIAIPVLLMSGGIDQAGRVRALAAGAVAVVEKPLDLAELTEVMSRTQIRP